MKPASTAPSIRRKPNRKSILEELKFLKSLRDLKYLAQKVAYVLPRLTGRVARWTEVPPAIQIEPTLHCNIDCITCCRSQGTRPAGAMDFSLFRKIIDDAAAIGVRRVLLFIFGEPLLHPQIVEMIRYIKSAGLAFHLTTNGELLDKSMGEAILGAGVTSADYLTFSILGFSKAVHEQVMKGIDHDRVVKNVLQFLENRKRSGVNGPIVETVFYSIAENRHELEPFLEYWGEVADHAINGGSAVEAFIDPQRPGPCRTRTCAQLWERMAILWNGDVSICGEDLNGDWLVGNLRDQSIRQVWQGEALSQARKAHKQGQFGQISLCKFCDW
jgi:radical SAM protein with 4Fe4S-binding SPASM domain